MAGYLTTHVLDTARGRPAEGVRIALYRLSSGGRERLAEAVTNADGRTDAPLYDNASLKRGTYRLEFDVAAYFKSRGVQLPDPPFLDRVALDFGIANEQQHYHVPLLVSPWSYSTYRGS